MSDWKDIIKTVAPTIGTALFGPLGGAATAILGDVFLGDGEADISQIEDIVVNNKMTPEQLGALKQAENDFKLKLNEQGIRLEELDFKDRDSARKREMEVGSLAVNVLAFIIIAGFFLTVYTVLTGGLGAIDAQSAMLIGTVIGYVSAKADQVVAYFFGSSRGSKEKTKAMSDAMAGKIKGLK